MANGFATLCKSRIKRVCCRSNAVGETPEVVQYAMQSKPKLGLFEISKTARQATIQQKIKTSKLDRVGKQELDKPRKFI